ncbi:MAG: hypothetical protein DME05_19815 [Candidatus Rokuibacteriota bacterium]|nr:MAG: hypothetical protein DME05_19815 [Candidatus Rokubacteria bacterium]
MIRALVVVLVLALTATGAVWWLWADDGGVTIDAIGDQNQTVARGQLPVFAARGDAARLYTFALANPDTLGKIPCTCGCERFGHVATSRMSRRRGSPSRATPRPERSASTSRGT